MKPTDVQTEILAAATTLNLPPEQFHQLSDADAERVYRACLAEFVTAAFEPRWWWEHLREPRTQFYPKNGILGFSLLPRLVPDPDAPCHFIAEDDDAPFYPVYLSTPCITASIIGECFGFEYYLISLDRSWLIGESHHDRIFGVGDAVIPLLNDYAATTENEQNGFR